jgi:hypothetical protein
VKCIVLRSVIKKFDTYRTAEQEIISLTIEKIKDYVETRQASYGLRIKRLSSHIYEGRINIHLRIAYFHQKDEVKLFCLGNHDEIRRCLKNLKQLHLSSEELGSSI